jgi:hypothetical protein
MKRTFDNFTAVDSGLIQDKVINDDYFNLFGRVVDTVTMAAQSAGQTIGNIVETGSQIIQGQTTGMNQSGCIRPLGYALDKLKLKQSSRNYDACLAAANAVDPDTQAFENLVAQLPEKYQTALESANLSYDLNDTQKQKLIDDITAIAKNTNLSGAGKLNQAINVIENALPYLKQSATMGGATMGQSPNQTRSASSDQELADARKKAWIGLGVVGGVAVLGYVTYLIIKKRK